MSELLLFGWKKGMESRKRVKAGSLGMSRGLGVKREKLFMF